mgnify:CR=1 FL=1
MAKAWKQVGGDVNPKDYGAVLARVDGDSVEVVRIEPNEEGPGWHVTTCNFHTSDLEWGGQAHPEQMSGTMDFTKEEWDQTPIDGRGAIALQYHGSGWCGDDRLVTKWSQALPARPNQIKWWR